MIDVLIADDHQILREGLGELLSGQKDMSVVGKAADGREAVELAKSLKPDVVLMDVSLPELNGMDATYQIHHDLPRTRVLALSMHAEPRFVKEMLSAGASGYLLKDSAFEDLISAIRTVIRGKRYVSPQVAGDILTEILEKSGEEDGSILTRREREVLQMLAEGKSTKEQADALNVSVKTVETHRKRIMDKLDRRSIAELTKYAIREGYTSI